MFTRRDVWRRLFILGTILGLLFIVSRLPVGQQVTLGLSQLLYVAQTPGRWIDEFSLWFEERQALQQALVEAKRVIGQRAQLIQQSGSLREENRRLRALLKIADIEGYQWRAAQVLGRSPEKKSQHLILQVNASVDDVVVASSGLVGLVDQSHDNTAVVRTILDGSIMVPVTLPDSPLAALIRGEGDHLSVDFVPIKLAPVVGDVLQTSGAGGLFPPGIPVAYVTHVEPVPGRVFAKVTASPTAHWQRDNWLAIASRAPLRNHP